MKEYNELVNHIKENITISEVVQKLGILQLKKKGNSLVGNCPTHHSSTSGTCFNVLTDKNFCYCHNCGVGGSSIDLVMLTLNIDFKEALEWFNKSFNLGYSNNFSGINFVKTPEELQREKELKVKAFLLEELLTEGKRMLFKPEGKDALAYLVNERKFDEEKIKQTELFYLPSTSEAKQLLHQAFPNMSNQINALKLEGHYGDNFRLAFPYRDIQGRITGLIKRATTPEGASGTTWDGEEFTKQRFDSTTGLTKDDLFGLHKIKGLDTILIVEGYLDAIYLYELGIKNVSAVGQGKLSKNHLTGLNKKKAKNVIIAFDNDDVGPDNTRVAVQLLLGSTAITPFVLDPKELGTHKDPDEFVRANGIDAFKELLDKKISKGSVWLAEYILADYENQNVLEKQKSIDQVIELIQSLKSPLDAEELTSLLSKKLNQTKTIVKDMIKVKQKNFKPSEKVTTGKFWTIDADGLQITMTDYMDFVMEEGFAKYYLDKEYTFIRTKDNIVNEFSLPKIKDHIFSYVEQIENDEQGTRRELYETFYNYVGQYFNEGLIECIRPKKITFKRDGADDAFLYYKNGFVNLKRSTEAEINSYEKLESPIWGHLINERSIDLIRIKYKKPEFEQFLWNVVGGNEERFLSMCSAIGYMLHDYKEDSNTKAVILCDQKISDNPNGRTGKSMIGKAIEKIKNISRVDGKNYTFKEQFTFQMVELGTQIIDFNDVEANFDFEKLFSVITDSMSVEYKNKPPFTIPFSESPKIMLSTNYTIKGEGDSYSDRMFEIEFTDHYNAQHKPKDEFGHDFFTGWDEDEWNRFDNFMLECLQLYLDEGLIGCALINLSQRKLIDQTSVEFVEFAEQNIKKNTDYDLAQLYTDYKGHLGFDNDIFDKCPVKQNTFTMWLPIYAHFKGASFEKKKSNSRQKVKLAA